MRLKKSLTTRFVFHVALDEQMQVGVNLCHFLPYLPTTLESLTGDVSRHANTRPY